MSKKGKSKFTIETGAFRKVVCRNRKARYDFHIEDVYEAGMVLLGSEVKSLRGGKASLTEAYAKLDDNGELWLIGARIPEYPWAHHENHEPLRQRKLLLKKAELKKLSHKISEKGYTVVPLEIYFTERGVAKVSLGVGKGKREYDRREDIKERETQRELASVMKHSR